MSSFQNTTLFVGDLSVSCNEADLYQLFAAHGGVRNVRVMRTRKNLSLGYSFIEMTSHEQAVHVATRLNGAELCGRKIRIAFATQEQNSSKGRQGRSGGGGGSGNENSVQVGGLINQNFNSRAPTNEEIAAYGASLAGGYGGGRYSGNPAPAGMWALDQRNANRHPVLNDHHHQQQLNFASQKQQQGSGAVKMQPNCQNSVFFRFQLLKAENPMHRQVAINEPTIRDIFNCYGQVPNCVQDVTIRRMTESGEQKKGYGFIHFVDVLACAHALQNHPTVRHDGVTYVLEISKNLEKQIALELEKAGAGVGTVGAGAETAANPGVGASAGGGGASNSSSVSYGDFEITPAGSESRDYASQLACYSYDGADGTDGDSHTIGTAGKHSSDSYASSADNVNLFVSHSTSNDSADNFLSATNLGSLSLNANADNVGRSGSFAFTKAGSSSNEFSFWDGDDVRGTLVSDTAPDSGSRGARSPVGSPVLTSNRAKAGSDGVAAARDSQTSTPDASAQHAANSKDISPPPPGLSLDRDRDATSEGALVAASLMQRQQMYRMQQQKVGFHQQQMGFHQQQADSMAMPLAPPQGQGNPLYRGGNHVSGSSYMEQQLQQQASARIARGTQSFAPSAYTQMDSPVYAQNKTLQPQQHRRLQSQQNQQGLLQFQQQQMQMQMQMHAMAQQPSESSRMSFGAPMGTSYRQGGQHQQQSAQQQMRGDNFNAQRHQYQWQQQPQQQRMYTPAPGMGAPLDANTLQQQYFAMQHQEQQQLYRQLSK